MKDERSKIIIPLTTSKIITTHHRAHREIKEWLRCSFILITCHRFTERLSALSARSLASGRSNGPRLASIRRSGFGEAGRSTTRWAGRSAQRSHQHVFFSVNIILFLCVLCGYLSEFSLFAARELRIVALFGLSIFSL
jgi:hypothetical protein